MQPGFTEHGWGPWSAVNAISVFTIWCLFPESLALLFRSCYPVSKSTPRI